MFLVVFRNRKRADIDQAAYGAESEAMEAQAAAQPGYLSFKSYAADDGEFVALSEWADEAAARSWGKVAEHRAAQANGRSSYYVEYTLFACDNPHIRRFTRDDA